MSSSVFLSNVDDYLAPSQACVNPLFSEKTNAGNNETTTPATTATPPPANVVVPRVRQRRRPRPVNQQQQQRTNDETKQQDSIVKASIADCLACSGCVTTAETVLLEETHSLQLLRDTWQQQQQQQQSLSLVATLSPAAWADLMRHVPQQQQEDSSSSSSQYQRSSHDNVATMDPQVYRKSQCQWVTLLAETLGFSAVLDGNLPLQWSLEAAANEFCQKQRQEQPGTTNASASSSSSSSLLAASCPAVVCLVEKSSHGAVPHLSTTPSAQAMAGAFWKNMDHDCFHVAVMPCHDKKLEASRPELLGSAAKDNNNNNNKNNNNNNNKDGATTTTKQVDLVLTTQDCVKLILERLGVTKSDHDDDDKAVLQKRLSRAVLARVVEIGTDADDAKEIPRVDWSTPTLWTCPLEQQIQTTTTVHNGQITTAASAAEQVFAYGSGGYADYIFRHASRVLYGVTDLPPSLPWKPVATTANKRVSARVAAASTQRDYYQVALYRQTDGSYALTESSLSLPSPPVLCFALAYGMQTLQRVLAPYETSKGTPPFDYVEAMACPAGCVNGGGQLRLAERERPTQTKERVQATRQNFQRPAAGVAPPSWMTTLPPPAEFRAVPPLQLAQGAVKGVAVKDVQW